MSDVQEPTAAVQSTGFERVVPPRRPKFDELFAGAIEEQLSEQRTLNELLARVETALSELRAELARAAEPPPPADDTAAREALAAVERAAAQLQESFPQRLTEVREAVVEAMTAREGGETSQAAEAVRSAIDTLREQANVVGKVHQSLVDRNTESVDRLSALVESTATGQQSTVASLESATARIETLQHEMRDRLAEIVASSVSDLEQASAQAAASQAEQLRDALASVRSAAEQAGADLPNRVEAAASELRAVIEDAAKRLGETSRAESAELSEAAATLARVAAGLGPAIATTAREVRTAMREAVDEDRHHVEEILGRRTDEMRNAVGERIDAAGAQIAAEAERLRSLHESTLAGLGGRDDEIRTAMAAELKKVSDSSAGVLAALQETTASVGAGFSERIDAAGRSIAEVVNEVRESLVTTAAADRDEMRDALSDLRGSAKQIADELQVSLEQTDAARTTSTAELTSLGKSVRGLQTEIEGLAVRLGAAVTEQESRARAASDGLGERVETLLENFRGAAQAELTTIQRTVAGLREELEHSTRGSSGLLEKMVARLDEAAVQHVTAASNAAEEVLHRTRSLEDTASALARVAGNIEPALAETAGEVLTALRQTAKDDRAQMRDGIARIQQSAERMGESLQTTMVRHIDAIHASSTAELAGANQSLAAARRALEDSAGALTQSVARQASESGAATGAQVAELQVALDDVRTLLEQTLREVRTAPAPAPAPAVAPAPAPVAPPVAVFPVAAPVEAVRDSDPIEEIRGSDDADDAADIDAESLAATLSIFGGPSGTSNDDEDDPDDDYY